LLQAEDQYKNFIVFFPTHPKAADAQMRVISANMKMMRAPDRDQQYSFRAEHEIRKMLEQFPNSDFIPIVEKYLIEVQERLARGDFGVGKFYAGRNNYSGAKLRYQEIIDNYANYSAYDEALFHLADALEKLNRPDEAAIYYARIASGYPFSELFDVAKERLLALGKPLPEVDTHLAALNEAKLKPAEGFSPLKPLVDFAAALGFKGEPDRYEAAKKMIEAEKAETPEVLASAPAEGGKETDDILIQTTLRKDASGKTEEITILGADTSGSQSSASNDADDNDPSPDNEENEE